MSYRRILVEPLTPTIGATIRGIDLANEPDDATIREIHDALMAHQVVFFRDQVMTPEQHLAFGQRFGKLHVHPAAPYANGIPELMVIHTDADSKRNNGGGWHSDVSAEEAPPMGTILRIDRVPSQGGDTLFASMTAAYEALSPHLRAFLDGLTAEHRADYTGFYGEHTPQRAAPRAIHPVVRTHPVTRRKGLFVNAGFTRRVMELAPAESAALLAFLFDHVKEPRFQCRFRWEQNSVAFWDNRCTQHLAVWDYHPETRSGLRVTIQGDRPFH